MMQVWRLDTSLWNVKSLQAMGVKPALIWVFFDLSTITMSHPLG